MTTKQRKYALRPKLIALAVASCFMSDAAIANPTGAQVVNGAASITQAGNLLQITNTPNTIINWQNFSIGASEITRFLQQSAASAVLNRVITQNPSAILGALQSNGRVFLINPNGIVFGAGAQVDVAGLVASTLNLSNADFLAGRMNFTEVPGAGSVVNQGNITTGSGGQVYLIAPDVTNSGVITSPQGEVVLAAGKSVELVNPSTPNLRVEIAAADNEARNLGTIVSDAGRVGIYAGLINQSGTVRADSVVSEGGRILLKATKSVTLEDSSVLSAQGQGGGDIRVLADESVKVAGKLDASAPVAGDGGFIETSAKNVNFSSGTEVITGAANGRTGTYLIDPTDYTIAPSGGDITGTDLSTLLGSNNVVLTTDDGGGGVSGNMNVSDAVSWNSSNSLTLLARTSLYVNQPITNAGTGNVNLYSGWDGGSTTTPAVTLGSGYLQLGSFAGAPGPLTTGGDVILVSGGGIWQQSNSPVTANGLLADGGAGSVYMTAPNMVNILAGRASAELSPGVYWSGGNFEFVNDKSLTIGSVTGPSGTVNGVAADNGNVFIGQFTPVNGTLTVNQPVRATTRYEDVEGPYAPDVLVNLRATGDVQINSEVSATAADNLFDNLATPDSISWVRGGSASIDINSSTGNIVATGAGNIVAKGGYGGKVSSTVYSVAASGGGATIVLNAGAAITFDGNASVTAGAGGTAVTTAGDSYTAEASAGGAYVDIYAATGTTGGGSIVATGGTGGVADGGYVVEARGGYAQATVSSGAGVALTGAVTTVGGDGGSAKATNFTLASSYINAYADGGSGYVYMSGDTGSVSAGNLTATGGAGGIATASSTAADGSAYASASGGYGQSSLNSYSGDVYLIGSAMMTGGAGGSGSAVASGTGYASAYANGGQTYLDFYSSIGNVQVTGTVSGSGGAGGSATATGGTYGYASARGGSADMYASGPAGVATGGAVAMRGGLGGVATISGSDPLSGYAYADGGEGSIQLTAYSGPIMIGAGGLAAIAGNAGSATSDGYGASAVGGYADVYLYAVTDMTLTGGITVTAGRGGAATNSSTEDGTYASSDGGSAWADLYGGTGTLSGNGAIAVTAGAGGTASGASYVDAGGGDSDVYINSDGLIGLSGSVTAIGGIGGTATATSPTFYGNAYAWGGDAWITVENGDTGAVQLTGATTAIGGAGGTAMATSPTAYANALGGWGEIYAYGETSLVMSGPATMTGGAGGSATAAVPGNRNADGGEGGGYITASGPITLGANWTATGGNAGSGGDGNGGNAPLYVQAYGGALQVPGSLGATGGNGSGAGVPGYGYIGLSGDSVTLGQATASTNVDVSAMVGAIVDGNAGLNVVAPMAVLSGPMGVGSFADPLETSVLNLSLNSTGGTGEIGISNTGNLSLDSLNFSGTTATVGTTGLMSLGGPLSGISGNLTLLGNSGIQVNQNIDATGNVILNGGAGNLDIVGTHVSGGGVVTLSGGNVNVGSASASTDAYAWGVNGLEVIATGSVNVTGGSGSYASAHIEASNNNLTVVAGGNVNVTGGSGMYSPAGIYGYPDVNMTVGGTVNLAAGSGTGSFAVIEAMTPLSINLGLPSLATGGYFVNGVEGVVYDATTETGFMADGAPAILGVNFNVTYGLSSSELPPSVEQVINQIVSTTNEQTIINESAVTETTSNGEEGDKKKKSLPVCS